MTKQYQIQTNTGRFFHYADNKKECLLAAQKIVKKFATMYGDTIIKISRV